MACRISGGLSTATMPFMPFGETHPSRPFKGGLLKLTAESVFDVIVHGCTCHSTMGAGLAKSIKEQFPEA